MDWSFLDKMDKNFLYTYAEQVAKKRGRVYFQSMLNNILENESDERNEMIIAENRCKSAYYMIWFIYRYVLGCKTLEDALKYANEETLEKYRISSLFRHNQHRIYIGIYGINEVYLYNYKGGDIDIVLEILYNRYDFFEQLECFIRHTEGTTRKSCSRCKKIIKQTLEMMKDRPEFESIIQRYYERNGKGRK